MTDPKRIDYSDPIRAMRATIEADGPYSYWPALQDFQLRKLATAVLSCADGIGEVTYHATREQWERLPGLPAHMRRDLRQRLLNQLADTGRVPTRLPTEERRYYAAGMSIDNPLLGAPLPPEVVADPVALDHHWSSMVMVLWVPYREPAIDRAAAVTAGLVYGPEHAG